MTAGETRRNDFESVAVNIWLVESHRNHSSEPPANLDDRLAALNKESQREGNQPLVFSSRVGFTDVKPTGLNAPTVDESDRILRFSPRSAEEPADTVAWHGVIARWSWSTVSSMRVSRLKHTLTTSSWVSKAVSRSRVPISRTLRLVSVFRFIGSFLHSSQCRGHSRCCSRVLVEALLPSSARPDG